MLISVIIATFDRRESLSACLACVLAQDVPDDRYEIVVVVDGSHDGTREMLASLPDPGRVIVVDQPNRGQSAARNAGARAAKGDLLLFLDDDLTCDAGLVSAHLAMHSGREARLVFGRMRHESGPPHRGFAERQSGTLLGDYYLRLDQDPCPRWPDDAWVGPNCSLPRAVFLGSGGYDERRFARRMEDVDLGLRLWKAGLAFRFAPQAITWHRWTKTDEQCWRDAESDGAGTVALCRKHPEYRVHALMPGLVDAPRWKSWAARTMAEFPRITRFALGALARLISAGPRSEWRLQLAERLFRIRQGSAFLGGACREAGSWPELHRMFGKRVAVLLYHNVGSPAPAPEDASITLSPERFDRHLRYLRARGYAGITAAQWLAWISSGATIPEKAVVITFDDGYASFAKHALPILERHGFGASQFVITGLMGTGAQWAGLPLMTAGEIIDCHNRGVEIGGHSRSHPNLSALAPGDASEEIRGCRQDLQALGIMPGAFAYPFGYHDAVVRSRARSEFRLAFTCDEGINGLRADPGSLKRTMVQPGDTLIDIELRAALGWSPFSELRGFLRLRTRARTVWRQFVTFLGFHRQAG